MSRGGFGSLVMAASVAGAALGCYLVSLNVASERAQLESVESRIVNTQREIRVLQTEIGTRGRLAQLERWNVNFIRLSAPSADQILEGSFQLASMVKPPTKPALDAPMVLASAPAPAPGQAPDAGRQAGARPDQLMQVASYTVPVRGDVGQARVAGPSAEPAKPATKKAAADKAEKAKADPAKLAEARPRAAPAKAKPVSADPLAPLPTVKAKPARDDASAQ